MFKTAQQRLDAYQRRFYKNAYELAAEIGLARAHYSQIVNGKRLPGMATAFRIQDVTGIPARSWMPTRVGKSKRPRKHRPEPAQVA